MKEIRTMCSANQYKKKNNDMDYQAAIVQAIKELNDAKGSSMPSIKSIVRNKLPEGCDWDNAAFLLALKKGVKTGLFVHTLPHQLSSEQKHARTALTKEVAPKAKDTNTDDKMAAANLRALKEGTQTEEPMHIVPHLQSSELKCLDTALTTVSPTDKVSTPGNDEKLAIAMVTSTSTNTIRPFPNGSNESSRQDDEDIKSKANHFAEVQARRRQISVQLQLTCLLHAVVCNNPKCAWEKCAHLKKYLRHSQQCQVKAAGGCLACKYIGTILIAHARQCRMNRCPVPNCARVRHCLATNCTKNTAKAK